MQYIVSRNAKNLDEALICVIGTCMSNTISFGNICFGKLKIVLYNGIYASCCFGWCKDIDFVACKKATSLRW